MLIGTLHYSRQDEAEADDFAIASLQAIGVSPLHLARFFRQLQGRNSDPSPFSWLSTHPDAGERAERAERAAAAASAPLR